MARIETRERMGGLLERWRRSGESAAAFCRRERIKPQKLSYWKRALGLAGPRVRRRRSAGRTGGGLVPVRLVGIGEGAAGSLAIELVSGDRLVVQEGVSRELLRDALAVLRGRC